MPIHFIGFIGGTGGASTIMIESADRFRRAGNDVRIFVPESPPGIPQFVARCRERGIPVETSRSLDPGKRRLAALWSALREVARHRSGGLRAPMVHWHVTDNAITHYWLRAMRRLGTPPSVATIHNPDDSVPANHPWMREWAAAVPAVIARVIAVSSRSRQQQIGFGIAPEHVALVRNGVDVAAWAGGDGGAIRQELGLTAGDPLVVYIARLEPVKRPLDAVAAFASIAELFPSATMALLGQGALEIAVRDDIAARGLAARVLLPGFRTDVRDWLAAASVLLFTTELEGNSLVVHEAMAAGCAIVSTVSPGNDEVLVDRVNALTTAIGDTSAQGAAIAALLGDRALRADIVAAARQMADTNSIERVNRAQMQIYKSVLHLRAG